MDAQQVKAIFDETFSGLALFYRDTDLAESLVGQYRVGQIIMERGFTDITYKGGGPAGNVRYLIASSQGRDLSALDPKAAEVGHILLSSNAHFKVLDIYRIGNKTQVFLLHIPAHATDFFRGSSSNLEQEIIPKAREGFESKIALPVLPELQTQAWRERTEFPLGMDNAGVLFPVEGHPTKGHPPADGDTPKKPWWKIW